jgi:hypothetical protein
VTGYYDLPDTVDCENCGHDIFSRHDLKGCHVNEDDEMNACPCKDRWTRNDKRHLAKDYGVRYGT